MDLRLATISAIGKVITRRRVLDFAFTMRLILASEATHTSPGRCRALRNQISYMHRRQHVITRRVDGLGRIWKGNLKPFLPVLNLLTALKLKHVIQLIRFGGDGQVRLFRRLRSLTRTLGTRGVSVTGPLVWALSWRRIQRLIHRI